MLSWGRLVQDEPVHPYLSYRLDEPREVDRLPDVAVRAKLVSAEEVGLLLGRGEDDDREQLRLRILTELPEHLEAIDLRQLQVEQHDLRIWFAPARVHATFDKPIERVGTVSDDDDAVAHVVLGKCAQGESLVVGVVLDEEYHLGFVEHRTPPPAGFRDGSASREGPRFIGVLTSSRQAILTYSLKPTDPKSQTRR